MRHCIFCVLLVFTVCLFAVGVEATTLVYDTGEVALNGTHPSNGDNVTSGGWTYGSSPHGGNYGIYSNNAAYEGDLGIELYGHGTSITSPTFSANLVTASVTTQIASIDNGMGGGGADAIDFAGSYFVLYSGADRIKLAPYAGDEDYNFYYYIYKDNITVNSGIIPNVTIPYQTWWTYNIETTDHNTAIFTINDGTNTGSLEVAHPFDNFTKVMFFVNRWSSGSEGAVAYFDNLEVSAAPIPEPTTMLLLGSGLIGLAGFRRKIRMRRQ